MLVSWGVDRVPDERWIRRSRWAVAVGASLTLIQTAWIHWQVLDGSTVRIPRLELLTTGAVTASVGLIAWLAGTVAFLSSPTQRVRLGWLLPAGALFTMLLDRQTSLGSFGLLVVVFSGLHWLSTFLGERPHLAKIRGAPLRLIQTQISAVFLWTMIAKFSPIFLSGTLLAASFRGPVPLPVDPGRGGYQALAVATVVAEGLLAVGLWWPLTRRPALWAALVFHAVIVLFLTPTLGLLAFAAVMAGGYLLFAGEPWNRG